MIRSCGVSETGPVRKNNEDFFVNDDALQLFVVADGMGGHSAGEVASRLAVEAVEGFVRRSTEETEFSWPYGIDPTLSYDGNRLRTAISLANRRVYRAAENSDDYTGMGTTIVTALVSGARLVVGSVGDSRLYLVHDGRLTQLTQDDSWGATVLAQEPLDPSLLVQHPMRNVLTNVLGVREQADIHMSERELAGGETLLLCTDGVHTVLDEQAIVSVVGNGADLSGKARQLVETALERGSRDNVTVLLVSYLP